jgi:hypothetical protein
MDLKKANDTLDRGRTVEALKGYGVGLNIMQFIEELGKRIPSI